MFYLVSGSRIALQEKRGLAVTGGLYPVLLSQALEGTPLKKAYKKGAVVRCPAPWSGTASEK